MDGGRGPILVVPSRHGSVPNLTPDQARAVLSPEERLLSVSVFDAQEFVAPCTTSGRTLAQFCGLSDFRVLLSLRSCFQGMHPSAPSSDKQIAGDHERGRTAVSLSQWRTTANALQPDFAVAMHESVPLSEPVNRKRKTAQTRTDVWLEQTAQNTPVVRGSHTVTILYPHSHPHEDCPVVIDTVPRNENAFEYAASLQSAVDSSKAPTFCVASSLPAFLAAVSAGVQMIECPLAWSLAAEGIALTLCLQEDAGKECTASPVACPTEPQIDLNDAAFALDISPLSEHCTCFTCQRHCRGYIHHLLTVQEMNSEILLTIHNLTQLVALCRQCRERSPTERQRLIQRLVGQL